MAIEILTCACNSVLKYKDSKTDHITDNLYANIVTEELLYNEGAVFVLLDASLDSWERLRKSAFDLLSAFPSPLSGIDTCDALCERLVWAKSMLLSPLVKESDAAALQVRLWIRKYLFDMDWRFQLVPEVSVWVQRPSDHSSAAVSLLGAYYYYYYFFFE